MMPDDTWYVRSKGRILGPFQRSKLEILRDRSMLSRFDEVSNDGKIWNSASIVPSLFNEIKDDIVVSDQSAQILIEQDINQFKKAIESNVDQNDSARTVRWYYVKDGVHVGPISFSDLQVLAARGELIEQSLVWNEKLPSWVYASTLSGIVFPRFVKNSSFPNPENMPFQIEYIDKSSSNPQENKSIHGGVNSTRISSFAVSGFALGLTASILCLSIYGIIVGTRTKLIVFNAYNMLVAVPIMTFVSLVCAILATIFSSISLSSFSRYGKELKGKDMAICGLVFGISVMCLMLLLCWLPGYMASMIDGQVDK